MDIDNNERMTDMVKNPSHYEIEGLEPYQSIDVIKSVLKTQFKVFCIGNALKYLIRAEKKSSRGDGGFGSTGRF